jgi:hypothetical protein
MTDTLIDCPFCGSSNIDGPTSSGKGQWAVMCLGNGCYVRAAGNTKAKAIKKWNTRVTSSEISVASDELFRDISSAIMSAKETLATMTTERKLPALSSRAVSDGWKLSRALESLSKLSDRMTPKRESGWLPIETAPKDGFHIQLYKPDIQFTGFYTAHGWVANAPELPFLDGLTHWRPLFAPPKTEIEVESQK